MSISGEYLGKRTTNKIFVMGLVFFCLVRNEFHDGKHLDFDSYCGPTCWRAVAWWSLVDVVHHLRRGVDNVEHPHYRKWRLGIDMQIGKSKSV